MKNLFLKKVGFTLVELIVVITILAILGTVAFVYWQIYVKDTRDAVRITDLGSADKALRLYAVKNNNQFPLPDNGVEITYSGAEIRTQGVFGETVFKTVKIMNKEIVDPTTFEKYTYSVSNQGNEFEIGSIKEGGILETNNLVNKVYAGDIVVPAIIKGNYNGIMLKAQIGSIEYIFALPSIISSDLTDPTINYIINNEKLIYNGYGNIPESYKNSRFKTDGGGALNLVNIDKFVVFSGSIENLKKDEVKQLEFITNLQEAYSGTVIENQEVIKKISDYNVRNLYKSQELIKSYIDKNFKITSEKTPEPIVANCSEMTEYHIGVLNDFFEGSGYNGDVNYWCGVTDIIATNKGLSGKLPSEIGNLTNLITLYLNNNNLSGEIPNEIGNLVNLTHLRLYNNTLSGNIPSDIGNLVNLEYLEIANNNLTGDIPAEIGNLINLISLNLNTNELSGTIPSEVGNLTNLRILSLQRNSLSGLMPNEIGNLTNLTILYLNDNEISGVIPNEIGNLINLEYLRLYDNNLSGEIPNSIGNLNHLYKLNLYNNNLSGEIPNSIGNLNNLIVLRLYNNNLTGNIPSSIGSLDNLTDLWLDNNILTGDIPIEIGDLTNLISLNLNTNELSGVIPNEIGNLNNLKFLKLYNNQLSGNIPNSVGNLTNLVVLNLSNNHLNGGIISELGNLTDLEYLRLDQNNFSLEIPTELGNLINLKWLYLFNNNLVGGIPSELGNLINLTNLELENNTGSFGNLEYNFDKNSSNRTEGNITIGGNGTNVVITINP